MRENGREARLLLRAARAASLATSADGQPFVSLVTPATAADGSVLLLLSELSEHTRQLRADPRCAVMVVGPAVEANPQTAPRLTVTGVAVLEPDPALKRRWLAVHPYAAFYAGFGDFHLWRVALGEGSFIGGFARAYRLPAAELAPEPGAVATVAAAESAILAHCNDDHATAMTRIARRHGGAGEGWHLVGVDVDGCELACEERVLRVAWAEAVDGAGAIRAELVQLAGEARPTES